MTGVNCGLIIGLSLWGQNPWGMNNLLIFFLYVLLWMRRTTNLTKGGAGGGGVCSLLSCPRSSLFLFKCLLTVMRVIQRCVSLNQFYLHDKSVFSLLSLFHGGFQSEGRGQLGKINFLFTVFFDNNWKKNSIIFSFVWIILFIYKYKLSQITADFSFGDGKWNWLCVVFGVES